MPKANRNIKRIAIISSISAVVITAVLLTFLVFIPLSVPNYTVTFNTDGGNETYPDQIVKENGFVTPPGIPTKDGYSFECWIDTSVNQSWVFTANHVQQDTTLLAKWNLIEYTITYVLDGGVNDVRNLSTYTIEDSFPLEDASKEFYAFAGWKNSDGQIVSRIDKGTFGDISLYATWSQNEEQKIEEQEWLASHGGVAKLSTDGKTVTYGLYPQSLVTDTRITSKLFNMVAAEKPRIFDWYFYDNEYYVYVVANPYSSNYKFNDGTIINKKQWYWFKCEPIVWNVLSSNGNDYFLTTKYLLDSGDFDDDSNNYKDSQVRSWLNNDFYNQAFVLGDSFIKTTRVDNSVESTCLSPNEYVCEDTYDKLFLLSRKELTTEEYGFDSNPAENDLAKRCETTEYSRASGGWYDIFDDYSFTGTYWSRSPMTDRPTNVFGVDELGNIEGKYGFSIYGGSTCIRPAMHITIE